MSPWFVILTFATMLVGIPLLGFGVLHVYYGIRFMLPYVPSSKKSIDEMLSYIDNIKDVTVLDLGSGTGDIILEVARRGGRGIGIEINPLLVWITRFRAQYEGLSDRVSVLCGNMYSLPLPSADIVTLYVLKNPTARLAPKLATELPPHARIISHGFSIPDWKPLRESREVKVYALSDS
jgi:SAM-dependent methyltransferase